MPAGFKIELFADGLRAPRMLQGRAERRCLRCGDAGRAHSRAASGEGGKVVTNEVFASGLTRRSASPSFRTATIRNGSMSPTPTASSAFPIRPATSRRAARPRSIVASLPHDGGHSTRDIVFTPDGKRMLVSVGSSATSPRAWERRRAGWRRGRRRSRSARPGASEAERAAVLALRSRRQGPEDLCHRHPQLRRPCDPAADGLALVLDQRARRSRRRSRARLRHQREGGRASTAGRGSISATTKIRATPARGRTSRTR